MGHQQMDLVLQCLDDDTLQQLHADVEAVVMVNEKKGYERDRLIGQYLALVVELKIRELDDAGIPARAVA